MSPSALTAPPLDTTAPGAGRVQRKLHLVGGVENPRREHPAVSARWSLGPDGRPCMTWSQPPEPDRKCAR